MNVSKELVIKYLTEAIDKFKADSSEFDEEQMIKDFPGMKGYGIELLPLDHPNRW